MSISRSPGDIAFILTYLIAAGFAFRAWYQEQKRQDLRFYAILWAVIGVVLCLLAFQSATRGLNIVTDVFRQEAIQQHWYGSRRSLQKLLVLATAICAVPLLFGFLFLFRKVWRQYLPAGVALIALLIYGAVQAISFHEIDYRMHAKYAGLQGKTWCQLVCLLLVAGALYWSSRRNSAGAVVNRDLTPERPASPNISEPQRLPTRASRFLTASSILIALALFAAAHQRLIGVRWLYVALPATAVNVVLWLAYGRKLLGTLLRPLRFPIHSWLLLTPYLIFAVQSIVYRLMLHVSVTSQVCALAIYAGTFWMVVQIASTAAWRPLLNVLGGTGVVFCVEGLCQFLARVRTPGDILRALPFGNGLSDNAAGNLVRVVLPFWYWNGTAQLFFVFTAICLGLIAVTTGRQKRFWQSAVCLHVLCTLLTASRWGSACLLPVFGLFAVRHHRAARAFAGAVLGAMGLWLVRWTLKNVQDITRISGSLRFRFRRWVWCLDTTKTNPWFGGNALTWADFTRRPIGVDGLYFWMLGVGGWFTVATLLLLVVSHASLIWHTLRSELPMDLRELLFAYALGIGCLLLGGILETVLADPVFVLLFVVFSGLLIGSQRLILRPSTA